MEVMGYAPRENNYATFESSCLCAEVYQGSEIVIYTDGDLLRVYAAV